MKRLAVISCVLLAALVMNAEPFYVRINGSKDVAANATGVSDYQGRTQYAAFDVKLAKNDKLTCYDGGSGAAWHIGVMDEYGAYELFTNNGSAWVCNEAGSYNIYIKMKYEDDMWYIEEAAGEGCTDCDDPTPTPGYTSSVPSKCPDVMLQAFYWDSNEDETSGSKTYTYGRTKWVDFLNKKGSDGVQSVAEEMGQWFDLIWLPPFSKSTGGTGYLPICYSNLDSDWGKKKNLTKLVETFHDNGAKVVADIVINHVAGSSGWCTFAALNFGDYGSFRPDASWICSTDEMNWESKKDESASCFGKATGADDDGYDGEANFESGRDWDQKNPEVQKMCKAYLRWLRNVVKIDGFRYDYCKGFKNYLIGDYNSTAEAYFSVMEYWDGNVGTLKYHLDEAKRNSLTFDFATKFSAFNDGIANGNYGSLRGAGLLGAGEGKYAVTFLDSHDSFMRKNDEGYSSEFKGYGNSMNYPNLIKQCYAYMLSMPGIPCVFWPHWVAFKGDLKKMINARYKAGVHSESSVSDEAGTGYYKATITGTNGSIRLLVGPSSGYNSTPSGYTLAVKGDGFGVYYKMNSPRGDKNTERTPITESIEEVKNEQPVMRGEKFMQDGKLFIRVNEKVYDLMGNCVQ